MTDNTVEVPVEKLAAVVEAAVRSRHLSLALGMAIDNLKEHMPLKDPDFPVGTTFIAKWKNGIDRKELHFWVADDGPVCQDGDDSGWEYIDVDSIRLIQPPKEDLK